MRHRPRSPIVKERPTDSPLQLALRVNGDGVAARRMGRSESRWRADISGEAASIDAPGRETADWQRTSDGVCVSTAPSGSRWSLPPVGAKAGREAPDGRGDRRPEPPGIRVGDQADGVKATAAPLVA